MASSKITICSNALLKLGASPISSFEGTSTGVLLCSNLWPEVRDAVLRSHPWNCAIKRVALAPTSTEPVYDYGNAYTLPDDCLRLLEVKTDYDYRVEGREILATEDPLYIKYVYRNENVATYDALLISALTSYMQAELAYPITKSTTQQKAAWELFALKVRQARNVDGQEDPPVTFGDFPVIQVRG